MKVVLATGIYPPEPGGPATYVRHLAEELTNQGHTVTVITYGTPVRNDSDRWNVVAVPRTGGVLRRWRRYANALKAHAADADVVEAFSSVSCGIPLWLARLQKPRTFLRLGGDFFWERATDAGDRHTLREWTAQPSLHRRLMQRLLRTFDHIIYSTQWQRDLYAQYYRTLPPSSVIENAVPSPSTVHVPHAPSSPFRLLFLGRFVAFKNLPSLLMALSELPDTRLTLAGDGPLTAQLQDLVRTLDHADRITWVPVAQDEEKQRLFAEHDLLVLPSLTEISPNVALEARAAGLPVLLTEETGLSPMLRDGMILAPLRTPQQITLALRDAQSRLADYARQAAMPPAKRSWADVASEHDALFRMQP